MKNYTVISQTSKYGGYQWQTTICFDDNYTTEMIEKFLKDRSYNHAMHEANRRYEQIKNEYNLTREEFSRCFINSLHIIIKEGN